MTAIAGATALLNDLVRSVATAAVPSAGRPTLGAWADRLRDELRARVAEGRVTAQGLDEQLRQIETLSRAFCGDSAPPTRAARLAASYFGEGAAPTREECQFLANEMIRVLDVLRERLEPPGAPPAGPGGPGRP